MLNNYSPPQASLWQGRPDSLPNERIFQCVQCIDLNHTKLNPAEKPTFAFLGFCSDIGVKRNLGRPGAKAGPRALRQALANLPVHDFEEYVLLDVGDVYCDDDHLEQAQQDLAHIVTLLLNHAITPILFGGGHEIAWAHYQGIAAHQSHVNLGILNFDAHFDLRPLLANGQGSSGTSFLQIAKHRQQRNLDFSYLCIGIQPAANTQSLFTTARGLNVEFIPAMQFHSNQMEPISQQIKAFIAKQDALYVTFCLDVFAQAFAPGVSAPQALGLFPAHVVPLIHFLKQSNKVIGFDIAELAPALDQNNITAKLAADLVFDFLN